MMRSLKKAKTLFYNLPLMGKLVTLLFVAGIVPLIFISFYTYSHTRQQLINQKYANINSMNLQINNNIDNQMETFLQISSLLYTDVNLKGYLTKKYDFDIDFVNAYNYINDLLYKLMVANNKIIGITFYVFNPTIPSDGLFVMHVDNGALPFDWLKGDEASHGNVVYSDISVKTINKKSERVFSLGRVMNFESLNYPYGYLIMDINEEVLYSFIEKESRDKDIYITDEKGIILSTRDKSLISQSLDKTLGEKIFTDKPNNVQVMKIHNQNSMVVYNSMHNGWKTVTVIPMKNVFGEAVTSTNNIILVSVLCILASLCLIFIISRYFSIRFKELNKQIHMVENSNFNFQIEHMGNDEMGQLSAAFNKMAQKLNEAINEVYKKEILRRRAELVLLQSQINPHFLYNTLSGISSLALRNRDKEVSVFVNHLSQFYKTSLNLGKEYVPIKEELEITRHYIAIQNIRFNNMFVVSWEADESLYDIKTIKLILQPFVENVVNHAISDDTKPICITIRVYEADHCIFYEVIDDGIGIEQSKVKDLLCPDKALGYGIINVDNRVKLAYGEEYGVKIESSPGSGTKITIKTPRVDPDSQNV